jgi:hypothetical protein
MMISSISTRICSTLATQDRRPRLGRIASVTASLCLLAGLSAAQSFNIDIQKGSTLGTPNDFYGAAANQPGKWVIFAKKTNVPKALKDITNSWTGAKLTVAPSTGQPTYRQALTTPSGPDGALLNDFIYMGSQKLDWTFTGLREGVYDVYFYCYAGSACGAVNMIVNGGPAQTSTPSFWTGHVEGVSYLKSRVRIDPNNPNMNTINVFTEAPGQCGRASGFQLIHYPAVEVMPEVSKPDHAAAETVSELSRQLAPNAPLMSPLAGFAEDC